MGDNAIKLYTSIAASIVVRFLNSAQDQEHFDSWKKSFLKNCKFINIFFVTVLWCQRIWLGYLKLWREHNKMTEIGSRSAITRTLYNLIKQAPCKWYQKIGVWRENDSFGGKMSDDTVFTFVWRVEYSNIWMVRRMGLWTVGEEKKLILFPILWNLSLWIETVALCLACSQKAF